MSRTILVRSSRVRSIYNYPYVRIPVEAYRRAGIRVGEVLRVYAGDGVIVLARYGLTPEEVLRRVAAALGVDECGEAKGA